jgi:hypothetical protein
MDNEKPHQTFSIRFFSINVQNNNENSPKKTEQNFICSIFYQKFESIFVSKTVYDLFVWFDFVRFFLDVEWEVCFFKQTKVSPCSSRKVGI